jgi:acyl-CoA reductase-like NAD-dependent aldehyde dehydrogenase
MHLPVLKTYKLFIGGAFPRTESGREFAVRSSNGKSILAHACRASRKDLRDAVVAAAKAQPGWAKRAPSNRGQILYRAAEMLEHRSTEMIDELVRSTGTKPSKANEEVQTSIDRLIWYAGWADKYQHIFGTINPVASSHFSFSIPEPSGIVCIIAPNEPSLLGLVSLVSSAIVAGNTAVILASEKFPLPSITFAEILATSDLPAGVINILTGFREEIVPHMAKHMNVNAIVDGSNEQHLTSLVQQEGAANVKRVISKKWKPSDWFQEKTEDPYQMLETMEIKTTWHPIGY